MALQFPGLQTKIAQRAVSAFESHINGNIEIGRISIVFFNKIMAYDVSVTGAPGDTLAAFEKLSVTIFPGELLKGHITVERILLENGCFNFIQEGQRYSNLNRIFGYLPKPDSLRKPLRMPDMSVNELNLRNMRFVMRNLYKGTGDNIPGMMNFRNLNVSGINARFNRIRIDNNTISCRIRDLNCRERSGYELRSLSGYFSLDSCKTAIEGLRLRDAWSDIKAGHLSFGYNSGKDLKDFVNRIVLGADFKDAVLDFRSLGYFAKGLQDNKTVLNITGEVTGPVRRLTTNDLMVTSQDSTIVHIGAHITGLPDIDKTDFDLDIKRISTISPEVSELASAFSHKANTIHKIMPDTRINLSGEMKGTVHDFSSTGMITSSEGDIEYSAVMTRDSLHKVMDLSTTLSVSNLDIGKLINNEIFGETDLTAGLHASFKRPEDGGIAANLDSLRISRMSIKGYEYSDITLNGEMQNSMANIRIVSHDMALPTMFQSIINLDSVNKPKRIQLFLDVPYADLKTMNIINKGSISNMGITAGADLRLTDHSILGNVLLENISYTNDNGQYHIDSLYIRSAILENRNIVTVKSPIFNADYSGTGVPTALLERLKLAVRGNALADAVSVDTAVTSNSDGRYDFHLRTFDMSQICDIIMPGLHIADSTTVNMSLDNDNTLDFNAQSASVSFVTKSGKEVSLSDIMLSAGNLYGSMTGLLSIGRVNSGNILLDNFRLQTDEQDNALRTALSYNNADTTYLNTAADICMSRDTKGKLATTIIIDSSELNIRGHRWHMTPASVLISDKYYNIQGFKLIGDTDLLSISGTVSENPDDNISLTVDNMDLSVLNSFTSAGLELKGYLTGEISMFNFFSNMGVSMEMDGKNLSIFGKDLGDLEILSRRDISRDRFNVLINNYIGDTNPINVSGYYTPERNYMNLNLQLEHLQLSYLSPVLRDIMSIDKGSISGNIIISGQPDRLILNSDNCRLDSLSITPAFTKVPYVVDGPVTFSQRSINLNNLSISDPRGAKAVLQGNINHDSFRNIYLDAGLTFSDLMCLNTSAHDNSKFYGTAYATGNVSISGYMDNLLIDAQVATNDNTSVHIPLSSSSSATTTDLISYTDFRLPAGSTDMDDAANGSENKTRSHSNIEIRAMASITQGAELLVEMNKQFGGTLRCTGNGELELTFNPSRNVTDLRGDYTVADGSYHLTLSAIQSRDFTLDEGGSIAFNGDLKNTSLNVGATYRTKASISTLISDTTSVGNRRNVDCGIQLQGSLSNPEVSFSIDIPDLDPITKGRVESALSTPDKVLKQVMALLISGSFVPDEQSGIVNNSTILYSNASEILSNQFNNIFRQLDIPLDLGLNYQPGTATGGKDMFDVAISYQAFNNRLIINGNLGNSETSSNWAGDFEAEIKVDRQGKLRVTLFTRSADSYSNYLDNTQRSGFGITYQDEFDTFGDFLRNIFYSRKRKDEYELQLMREAEEELEKEAAEANIRKENVMKPKEDPMNLSEDTGYMEYKSGE